MAPHPLDFRSDATTSHTDRLMHSRDVAAKTTWITRLVLRLVAHRLNADVFSPVVMRALERGLINSFQAHELLADFDPTQRGVVGFLSDRRADR